MSDDSKDTGLLVRVQDAVRSSSRRVDHVRSGLMQRVRETVDETIAPAVEEAARKMLLKLAEPENAQKLQEALAGVAGFAMRSGFQSDHKARLLFDFVDELEKRHSREEVMQIVVQHAIVYEQDLLVTLLDSVQRGSTLNSMSAERFEAFRERASTKLLALLCSLVSLESDERAPSARAAQIAFFEEATPEERFRPLARMAAGEPDAFESLEDKPERDAKKRAGWLRRALDRVSSEETTALAKLMPSLADPATRFLTTSYLFFMQSYLVRAMIEELPEILAMVRDLERDMDAESPDVIDLDD